MNSFLRWTGAFAAVALVSFLAGFLLQSGKVSAAREETDVCERSAAVVQAVGARESTLVSLFRARHELARSNFGTAGEKLGEAKSKASAAGVTSALPHIDKAIDAALAQDASAADAIQEAVKAIDSAPAANVAAPETK